MNPMLIAVMVLASLVGWIVIMRSWRTGIYLLFCFTPITGLVVAAFQPSALGNLARDILIIIPLYVAFFFTKRPSDRAIVPAPVLFSAMAVAAIVIFGIVVRGMANPAVGLVGAKIWLMYMPLMLIGSAALSSRTDLERLLRTVVVTAWIPMVVGILMWAGAITYDYQKSVELLYGDFARNATQGFVAIKVGETTFYRIPSTFQFVSQYSAFCQFMMFPLVMLIRSDRSKGWRMFGYISLLVAILAALTSGARGAFLYLPLIFTMLAALRIGAGGRRNFGMTLVLLVAIGGAATYFDRGAIFDHLVELTELNGQAVVMGGLDYAMEAGGAWGAGVGTATIAARYVLDPSQVNVLFSTAIENYYAKAWLELGFLGFAAVVSLLAGIIITGWLSLSKIRDPRLRDCGVAVVGMTIYVAFISTRGWALDQDPFAYYYYLFAGFLFKLPVLASQQQPAGKVRQPRPAGPVRPVTVPGIRPNWR